MKIITVDPGKFNCKALCDMKKKIFRSSVQETSNTTINSMSNVYHIKWKDSEYLLGDGVKNIDYDTNKQKLQHKLSTYTACSEFLLDNEMYEEDLKLVVLCPISMFTNPQIKEEYKQYILDDGIVDITVNGINKTVIIDDVTIFSEACATAFSNHNTFKDNLVGIVDIGGLNCNGIILNKMTPVPYSDFTINAGSYIVKEKIKKELNKELKVNIQDYQMDNILKNGQYNYNINQSKEIIQSILSDHFKEILTNMKANNWDTKGLDIIITGGGSLDIGIQNIQTYLPQAILSDDPIWDNCKGGSIVGEIVYEER